MARSFAFFEKLKVGDYLEVVECGCFHDKYERKIAKVVKKEANRVYFTFSPTFENTTGNKHSRGCSTTPILKKLRIKNERDLKAHIVRIEL